MADYSNFKENELLKVESKFIHKGINHVEIYFARFVSHESIHGDAVVTTSVKIKQICNFKESLTKGEDEVYIYKDFDFHDLVTDDRINIKEINENIKSLNDKVGQLITLIKDSRV